MLDQDEVEYQTSTLVEYTLKEVQEGGTETEELQALRNIPQLGNWIHNRTRYQRQLPRDSNSWSRYGQ